MRKEEVIGLSKTNKIPEDRCQVLRNHPMGALYDVLDVPSSRLFFNPQYKNPLNFIIPTLHVKQQTKRFRVNCSSEH